MPRSIWTGAISFGLVNVPVKLYSAVSKKTVRFHQLHETDGVRIQQKRVCPADGEEVSYDQIVKGYEITPDQYVVVTPEELEAIEPRKTKTIDIEDFVDLEDIETSKREVDMAQQLIESLSAEFDPSKYPDTYRERVLELIERKAEGKEIAVQPAEEPQPVPDLMAALEASVNAARQNRETGGRPSGNGASAEKPKT